MTKKSGAGKVCHNPATPKQVANITQLNRQLTNIRSDWNAFLTNFLMYFPLPHIVHYLALRSPFLPIEEMLISHATRTFDNNIGPQLNRLMQKAWRLLAAITDEHRSEINELLNIATNLTHENTVDFIEKVTPYMDLCITQMNQPNQLPPGTNLTEFTLYTTLFTIISTTVNHLYNRSQLMHVLPITFSVRILSFMAKRYVVDPLADRYFPRGIIPIGRYTTVNPEQLTLEDADKVEHELLGTINNNSYFGLLIKLMSIIYSLGYLAFAVYRLYNPTTPNVDLQELEFYDTFLAPTFLTFLFIAGRNSISAAIQCWQSFRFYEKLNTNFDNIRLLTTNIFNGTNFDWKKEEGPTLERSFYVLHLEPEYSLSSELKLKSKHFCEAIEQVVGGSLEILSMSKDEIIFAADIKISIDQLVKFQRSIQQYCEHLAKLNNTLSLLKRQLSQLMKQCNSACVTMRRTDKDGNPVLLLIAPPDAAALFEEAAFEVHCNKSTLGQHHVYFHEALDNTQFKKFHNAFSNLSSDAAASTTEYCQSAYNIKQIHKPPTVNLKKRKHQYPSDEEASAAHTHAKIFNINWGRDVFVLGNEGQSTVSAMYGRIVYPHCFFAKYNAIIDDARMRKAFMDKINAGHVVGPEGEEGILINEENRRVRDPHTGKYFVPEWKVKVKGEFGMYRLFGRVVNTVTKEKHPRHLVEFTVCIRTHH